VRVVLTREAGMNDSLRWLLPPESQVVEVPLTHTKYLGDESILEQVQSVVGMKTVAITSARSVRALSGPLRDFSHLPIYCVGEATAKSLRESGIEPAWVGTNGAAELANEIPSGPVLFVGAKENREELAEALARRTIELHSVSSYETLPVELTEGEIVEIGSADVLFIGAPSAWSVAEQFVGEKTVIVAKGETTAQVVKVSHPETIVGWGSETKEILAELAKSNN